MLSELFASSASSPDVGKEFVAYARRRLLEEYFPRIQRCFDELSNDDIWWRAHETDNSIGNLILHLNGNIRQWIISGLGDAPDRRIRQAEFDDRSRIPKEELLSIFEATLHEADSVLERLDTTKLLEMLHIQVFDVTCLDAISHVVEHVAQHLGQIIYVTKLRTAKDLKFYDL